MGSNRPDTGRTVEIYWSDLTPGDFATLGILLVFAFGPYVYAIRSEVSLALATGLSLLLVTFFQAGVYSLGLAFDPIAFLSLIPAIAFEPSMAHRWVTAGWLHAGWIHVLGNILVIALVGVPLEQRLGGRRWMTIYFVGLLAGNFSWVGTHIGDPGASLGASGAAFGLLGAYMAGWPRDEIEFPLLFLIRAWPVWLIALIKLGFEIYTMYELESLGQSTGIAHLAHVGGFFGAYVLIRPIARSGNVPLEGDLEEDEASGMMPIGVDPWRARGLEPSDPVKRILRRLREEGDEMETRQAWVEELAEQAICPECGGALEAVPKPMGGHVVVCSTNRKHLRWP